MNFYVLFSTNQSYFSPKSFYRDLLQQLIQLELINISFALEVDPLIANDNTPRLQADAQDAGLDLEVSSLIPWASYHVLIGFGSPILNPNYFLREALRILLLGLIEFGEMLEATGFLRMLC